MTSRVIEIIADVLEVEAGMINETSVKDDFDNWDSVAHLTIVAELEDAFEMSFTPDQIESINSIKDIISLLGTEA